MAEPVLEDTYLTFSSDFDYIAIPPSPFDNFCNSNSDQVRNSISDLRFLIDDDDSFDDLYFPSENESFCIPPDATKREMSGDFRPASGISGDCVNEDTEKNTNGVLISTSSCYNRESPTDSDFSGTSQSLSFSGQDSAKRKTEIEEDSSDESRRLGKDGFASVIKVGGEEDDEKKKNVRLVRNRESAHLSRQRKKHYVEELEDKVKNMHSTISELSSKMSYFVAENVTLRQQMGTRFSSGPPMVPIVYPWMQYPAYMVKPQGSQVALLPIPRLKPKHSVAKVKKFKKVASFSVFGFLFCMFLFGALVNISYGEYKSNYVTDGVYDQSRGRVLVVDSSRVHCGGDSDQGVGRNVSETENLGPPRNSSEPLVASLFVPRNEKLVKIDGNLIIHSVLASEKARDSETKNEEGKSVLATTTKTLSPALPLPDSTSPRTRDVSKHLYSETGKGLSSSGSDDASNDQLKSTIANGKMQQWFREGVAGPMFSSGMCTEVFQFDVSSNSGAIIPASPHTQQCKNTSDTQKGKKNRRILSGGLPVSDFNLTKEDHNSSSKDKFRETKPGPSMVVSVLVDPREGGNGDIDGMMGGTKPQSRVFIVVLVDGVKYITYSCVLPRPDVPHLMTS
ncbi:Basic-leucine zipper domain [Arabidopsis suecica]|uniref:Basic-leucine zipper domain n=1 Tax=Arabidopsis suecica TaxID=45249 RepID=A0A8T2FKE7_ARASU|nr:Basic-leucine zipper domain [Arabidopsis suecica]